MICSQTPSLVWSFQDGRQLASKPTHHKQRVARSNPIFEINIFETALFLSCEHCRRAGAKRLAPAFSTPTFLYFDLYLNTAYGAHYAYFIVRYLSYTIVILAYVIISSSSSRLSPQGGSGRLDTSLHSVLSSTLSRSTTLPSSRTQSIHRFLGRPLFLVPGSLHSTAHLTISFSSILFTVSIPS